MNKLKVQNVMSNVNQGISQFLTSASTNMFSLQLFYFSSRRVFPALKHLLFNVLFEPMNQKSHKVNFHYSFICHFIRDTLLFINKFASY